MPITVEAVYEGGVLKPVGPLPLKEHDRVRLTIEEAGGSARQTAGVVPCLDPKLIEWAATDGELEYPPPPEEP